MFLKLAPSLAGGKAGQPNVRLGKPGPRKREIGIKLYRVLIGCESLTLVLFRMAITKEAPLQIILVGLDVFGAAFFRSLHLSLNLSLVLRAAGQLTAQLFHDGLREFC